MIVPLKRIVATNAGSTSSVTTTAQATTTGNLLVAWIFSYTNTIGGASPVTDSAGNTWVQGIASFGVGQGFLAMYYCANATGNAAHTFTLTASGNSYIGIVVYEISGAKTSGVLGNTATVQSALATKTTASIAATQDELFIGFCTISASASGVGTPNGDGFKLTYQGLGAPSNEGYGTAFRGASNGESYNFSVTLSAASNESCAIAAFKAATSGGGGGSSEYAAVF